MYIWLEKEVCLEEFRVHLVQTLDFHAKM